MKFLQRRSIEPWEFGFELRAGENDTVAMVKTELFLRDAFPPGWQAWVERSGLRCCETLS